MKSITETTSHIKPVEAVRDQVQFGPVVLDGFMLMDNGEFRINLRSAADALGCHHSNVLQWVNKNLLTDSQQSQAKTAAIAKDLPSDTKGSQPLDPESLTYPNQLQRKASRRSQQVEIQLTQDFSETPLILPVKGNRTAPPQTLSLATVSAFWLSVSHSNSKYAERAKELIKICVTTTLERAFQEQYGVSDSRNTDQRLSDMWIRLNPDKHYPLFGGDFNREFARVTGVSVGHRASAVPLCELFYWRLPLKIQQDLKDLNPVIEETGWREFTYSQLMTDEMRAYMRELRAVIYNQLVNSPSKKDDPKAYRKLLHRLDKTLKRYTFRGREKGDGNIEALQAWRKSQKEQQS